MLAPAMRPSPCIFALASLVWLATAVLAVAQSVEPLGSSGKWRAFTFLEDGKKVCYMSAEPDKQERGNETRGDVYALVTHRPALNSRDVVSVVSGYALQPNGDVMVTVDGKQKFKMFADKGTAWAPDDKTDRALVLALKKGHAMVVQAVSARGTKTKDSYSLSGFGKMYQAISSACGIKG
jgi:invasion protein IalB